MCVLSQYVVLIKGVMEWKKDTERKGVYSIKKKGKGWVKEMHMNVVCLANWELDFEFGCFEV